MFRPFTFNVISNKLVLNHHLAFCVVGPLCSLFLLFSFLPSFGSVKDFNYCILCTFLGGILAKPLFYLFVLWLL